MIVCQLGGLFTGEATFGVWTIVAAVALAGILYLLFRRNKYTESAAGISLRSTAAAK